ncbi:hydrolase [Carbonactinospora thermoautotrophica]|uniref:zinc-dependent metalloprotease n=1 Tax=Carbonactinospora thermoautotrophica TaxID=1469144 RepID=UPI00226F4FA9|nr:zinc-dependent metalloprotease [Carbonactinospora thermoautotrophica]MCX9192523.1 hydrolase [Carbonactinospora thermoautotrophica]
MNKDDDRPDEGNDESRQERERSGQPPEGQPGGQGSSGGPGSSGAQGAGGLFGVGDFNPFADPRNPFLALFGQLDPQDLGATFQQLGQMLSGQAGGPVNWELAKHIARTALASRTDRFPTQQESVEVAEAVRLAELWLDEVTTLPAGTTDAVAWTRGEWIEATLPVWRQLVEPVASRVADAMEEVVPDEVRQMAGPLLSVMRNLGGSLFGAQLGQALATLAGEVVSSTEIGLPLGPPGKAALLPANIEEFSAGLGIPADQVLLFLALREAAHHRLFAHVPWLRAHLLGAVEGYARGIRVDRTRLDEMMGQFDLHNPEALQEALSSGMFEPRQTPEQAAALARLETALALVEGWVDATVEATAGKRLPAAAALRETIRRRRASGGPAEQTFAALVGLELRPRRLRDAARLWHLLTERHGIEGRDAVWGHPDLLPTAEDLDDPESFVDRSQLDLSGLLGDAEAGDNPPPKEPPADEREPDR